LLSLHRHMPSCLCHNGNAQNLKVSVFTSLYTEVSRKFLSSVRLRVVSNFGDSDRGAGENTHPRARGARFPRVLLEIS